jgi:hypothetical protein
VESYDPATGEWRNYGIIDDPGPPYYRYAYSLGADSRYIYIGIGQSPWYLVVYDKQTNAQTVYWKGTSNIVNVQRGTAGGWYAERSTSAGVKEWYALQNGVPVKLASAPSIVQYPFRGNILSDLNYSAQTYGYQVDLADAVPDSSTNGVATIRYRPAGAAAWRSVSTVPAMDPLPVKRLYTSDNRRFLGFTGTYGPVFQYDPATRSAYPLGRTGFSDYSAAYSAGKWWMAGYPAETMVYDPSRAWTLSASTPNKSDPYVNPFQARGAFGKYHYYTAAGADGAVYVGVHHERDSTGGELGWHIPASNTSGSIRTTFLNYDVRDLIAAKGALRMVYSSVAIVPGDSAKVFVLDTVTKQIVAQWTPVPGATETGKIAEVSTGEIMGVIPGATSAQVYRLNIDTGKVILYPPVPGKAFGGIMSYDRRLTKGPDGYL